MSKRKDKNKEATIEEAQRLTGQRMTPEQRQDIRRAFQMIDVNSSGSITVTEIRQACKKLKILLTKDEMEQMVAKYDANGNGSIDYKEFESIVSEQMLVAKYKDECMKNMFQQFDVDGDGYITKDEIRQVFHNTGVDLSEQEVDELIEEADENKDGVISYEEFVQTVCEKDW